MSYKALHGYMELCRHYGCTPTVAGLKAFAAGIRAGILARIGAV